MITTGSQHALELVSKLFIDPGDVVLAEGPSYVTAMVIFKSYQAEVNHVPMDDDGLIPEALRENIARLKADGKRIKFLYTIPTFHNPAGVTLSGRGGARSWRSRGRTTSSCWRTTPTACSTSTRSRPQRCARSNTDGVVYLGTFSKTLAPGFRVGWALAPHAIREKLILANEAAILCPSSFSQLVISQYLDQADWKGQINTFRGVYKERKETMLSALGEYLPDLTLDGTRTAASTSGSRCLSGWTRRRCCPARSRNSSPTRRAPRSSPTATGASNIRLSFCYPTPASIRVGIRRLATVINGELDLLDTFAGTGTPDQCALARLVHRASPQHVLTPCHTRPTEKA